MAAVAIFFIADLVVGARAWLNRPQVRTRALLEEIHRRDTDHLGFLGRTCNELGLGRDLRRVHDVGEDLFVLGPPTVPTLIEAVKDPSSIVREMAIEVLGEIGDPEAVPAILAAMDDTNESIREEAIRSLGAIGDRRAVPALLKALDDPNWRLRELAVQSLGLIGDSQAAPALLAAAREDPNPPVQWEALAALGRIGDPEALPLLKSALYYNPSLSAHKAAVFGLGRLGGPEALGPLIEALWDRHDLMRPFIIEEFGYLGDPRAAQVLLRIASDKTDAQVMALLSLAAIGAPQTGDVAVSLLEADPSQTPT